MTYLFLFLAVVAGYGLALLLKSGKTDRMPIYLAFSGAFLLSMTILELLPEVFEMPTDRIGIFIMAGILLQICLEFFSKGAEHGHVHINSLDKHFPWLLFVSLSVHALLEGFPISEENNMLIGVIVHKIPVAAILALFFIKSGYSKTIMLSFLLLFSLMTPLGSLLSHELHFLGIFATEITALVIGIFLHVSTTILYESSKDHRFNLAKLIIIIMGFGLAYII